jgi:hypothetical protein
MSPLSSPTTIDLRPAARPAGRPVDPRRFRRRVGGIALIGAPVALLASEVADRGSEKSAELINDAANHANALVVSNVLLLLSSALLVPAAFAVLHLARCRGRRFAEVGTALAVLGALGHAAFVGFSSVVLSTPQGDPAQMVALLDRVNHNPAIAPIAVCILAFALSLPLILIAAWRAELVPWVVPTLSGVAVAIELVGVDSMAGGVAKELLAVLALGWVGFRVLRLSDDDWAPAPITG